MQLLFKKLIIKIILLLLIKIILLLEIKNKDILSIIKPKSYQDVMIGMENQFITMDIETIIINNQVSIVISLYNGSNSNIQNNNKLLFNDTINDKILWKDFFNFIFYFNNISAFMGKIKIAITFK